MKWILILCLVTAALAANFKVPVNRHRLDRKTAILRTLTQKPMLPKSPKFNQRLNKGSVPITTYLDTFYVMNLTIGTPPQTFQVMVDTGDANFWVVGEDCVDPQCDGISDPSIQFWKKNKFHNELSSTFTRNDTPIYNGFTAYSYLGYLELDDVQIGGLTIKQQTFTNTYQIAEVFGYWPIDGVLGLAWKQLALEEVENPFFRLIPQLDQPIFTVWLDPRVDNKQGVVAGQITFGAFDNNNCDSNVFYVPLRSEDFWQFDIESVSFGKYQKRLTGNSAVDTGTSFIYGPDDQVDQITRIANATYDPDQYLNVVSCDAILPDLVFKINGHDFPVQGNELILDFGLGDNKCALAIYGAYTEVEWLLAEPFLRAYCTVHDAGNLQVGFAKSLP
ncbi:Peptidase A1 domain-containing protein [Aphelenchoides bicaudatus]|nr:Peptidase A1 domain-containing protein [Aphelenchoides bicaudatus]